MDLTNLRDRNARPVAPGSIPIGQEVSESSQQDVPVTQYEAEDKLAEQANMAYQPTNIIQSTLGVAVSHDTDVSESRWKPQCPSTWLDNESRGESRYGGYEGKESALTSPPEFFSAPISPLEKSIKDNNSYTDPSNSPETAVTSFRNVNERSESATFIPTYMGTAVDSLQKPPFNSCGIFGDSSNFSDASHGGVHTRMSPAMARNVSHRSTYDESPSGSHSNVRSRSRVRFDDVNLEMPSTPQRQAKTFPQLSAEKGIKPWLHRVADERWLENYRPHVASPRRQSPSKTREHQRRMEIFFRELDKINKKMKIHAGVFRPDPAIWGLENASPNYRRAIQGERADDQLIPQPPEPQNLRDVVQDLMAGTDTLPCGVPYSPDVVRRYLTDRVFEGDWDGRIPSPEGDSITKFDGNFISLQALRDKVLEGIEELVTSMTAPIQQELKSEIAHSSVETKGNKEGKPIEGGVPMKESDVSEYIPKINPQSQEHSLDRNTSRPTLEICSNPENRGVSTSAYQSSGGKVTAIESRQRIDEGSHGIEDRGDRESGPHSPSAKVAADQHKEVKSVSTDHKPHSLNTAIQRPPSPHQDHPSLPPSRTALVTSDKANMDFFNRAMMFEPQQPDPVMAEIEYQKREDLNTYLQGGTASPRHLQLPTGAVPTGTFNPTPRVHGLPPISHNQRGYGYGHPLFASIEPGSHYLQRNAHLLPYTPAPVQYGYVQPSYVTPHMQWSLPHRTIDLGPPPPPRDPREWRDRALNWGPPPPHSSNWGYEQPGKTRQSGDKPLPVPMSHPATVARAPAANRVAAQVYNLDTGFHDSSYQNRSTSARSITMGGASSGGTPQSRTTTSSDFTQNPYNQHEWQNRFGIQPTVKPDLPIQPYRAGSDDMRPTGIGGVSSMHYQKLTENTVPSAEAMKAPQNNPFEQTAKETKPPGWGVIKIGNVSMNAKE